MKTIYSRTIEKPAGFLFARWSAGAKAFELGLPKKERIIEDKLAPYYAGDIGLKMVAAMQQINPAIRKAIVLRARFMDDYSRRCLEEGFGQVVLLGAGYDSRYLRLKEFRQARIYELDLESTQTIKKSLTRRFLGRLPAHVTYVSLDFSKDSIIQKLKGAGFNAALKTLFIWEGVTLFLNEDIIAETLGRLAEIGPGNRIVFDFVPPELIDDATDYMGNRPLLQLCAAIKEPLTFGSTPDRMKSLLAGIGYSGISVTGMREAHQEFAGRSITEDCYYFATAQSGNGSIKVVTSFAGGDRNV